MKYIWRILRFSGFLWPYYLAVSIASILVASLNLLLPLLSGAAIDELRKGTTSNVRYLLFVALGVFLIDFGTTLISNLGGYLGDQMQVRLQKYLGMRYYEHLLSLPQQYYDKELSGKIINRLNRSINQISQFMQMWSNNFLQFVFSTIFALVAVAYFSWPIALLLFALYPIYVLMTVKTSGQWIKYAGKINKHLDVASGRFAEVITQIKVVKSYIQEKKELQFLNTHYSKVVGLTKPQSVLWHKKDIQRRFILSVIFYCVYTIIFVQGARGILSPGQAVALILFAMQIRIPIFTISFLVENTQRAIADSKDYFEIMNITPQILDIENAKTLQVQKGAIELRNVAFAYDDKPVLKNMSLVIKPDTKLALVGESGEGKTTIANLLLRLYDPNKGSILIDDQDIASVSQESLRKNIGVVFQDPALFSGTIKENISYANPDASEAQIEAAARDANAHNFIAKLEKGYDTEIGERGLKLSGGQKQRIAIARALLKDAPILILDEATSSLDSKSELMVQEALKRLMKNRTTIIIAHRLSTIQNVDTIVTLKNGAIDEIGSPHELEKTNGIYAQLLKLQQGHNEKTKRQLQKFDINE